MREFLWPVRACRGLEAGKRVGDVALTWSVNASWKIERFDVDSKSGEFCAVVNGIWV